MIAKQQSILSGFAYDIFTNNHGHVGSLRWPNFAVATNARLKLPGAVTNLRIDYQGQPYAIDFTYLRRGWANDVGFTLTSGNDVIGTADVLREKRLSRPTIYVRTPFSGRLVRRFSPLKTRYDVTMDGATVGRIGEESAFSFRRTLSIDLPESIAAPIQIFLLFLVCNDAYR